MKLKTIKDVDIRNKHVLLRVAFEVPIKNGRVGDDTRLKAALPTINYLLRNNCSIVLVSYLGRPKGKVVPGMKLDPVAQRLSEILKKPVKKLNDCVGKKVEDEVRLMKPKEVILLENTRFHPEEDKNDFNFAKKLANLGEIFVNDAFAQSHRNCASIVGVSKYLPSVAGLLLEKEIKILSKVILKPKKPLVCIIGGAKISDKIGLFYNLIKISDIITVGGAMALTFLKSQGVEVGRSLVEDQFLDEADEILREAENKGVEFLLPDDVVCVKKISEDSQPETRDLMEIEENDIIVDIGSGTVRKIAEPIKFAGTIVWNGPLGVTEIDKFSNGSLAVAKMIIESRAENVVGGGDTIAFIDKSGLKDRFDFISTGGGAMLEFLEGKELPGIRALEK